jgi:hypothetical protein
MSAGRESPGIKDRLDAPRGGQLRGLAAGQEPPAAMQPALRFTDARHVALGLPLLVTVDVQRPFLLPRNLKGVLAAVEQVDRVQPVTDRLKLPLQARMFVGHPLGQVFITFPDGPVMRLALTRDGAEARAKRQASGQQASDCASGQGQANVPVCRQSSRKYSGAAFPSLSSSLNGSTDSKKTCRDSLKWPWWSKLSHLSTTR